MGPPPGARPGPPPRPPKPVPALVIAIPFAVIALIVGLIGGAVAGNTVSQPVGPSAPPPIPPGFPRGEQRFLAVTVPSIAQDWLVKGNSWTCEPNTDNTPSRGGAHLTDCTPVGRLRNDINISIEHDDDTHVREVNASCTLGPGNPTCRAIFTDMAARVFPTDPGLQAQARTWTEQNMDSDNETTIGSVHLDASLEPQFLHATPAPG
jgi:hypothetical protein